MTLNTLADSPRPVPESVDDVCTASALACTGGPPAVHNSVHNSVHSRSPTATPQP